MHMHPLQDVHHHFFTSGVLIICHACILFAASEGARREALKKAGEAYFNKVLEKAQAGKDPFVPHPARLRKGADVEALDRDPDLEIVGLVLAGVRLYFIGALFVAASAVSFVLIKVGTGPSGMLAWGPGLEEPAFIMSMHLGRSRCSRCGHQASRPSCTASQWWPRSGSWSMSRPSRGRC